MMGNRAEGCLLAGLRTSVWQPQFRTPSTHKAAVRQGKVTAHPASLPGCHVGCRAGQLT